MLTDEQKKKITELRLQGLGYETIAKQLGDGVKKASVRYFCRSRGLVGTPDLIALNFDVHRENPVYCKQCGARLVRNRYSGVKLFCNEKCRREWWKEHPRDNEATRKKPIRLTCEYCKDKFISYGQPNRKYCCHDCYIKARFWSDPEAPVTKEEIEKRQAEKVAPKKATAIKLQRIS